MILQYFRKKRASLWLKKLKFRRQSSKIGVLLFLILLLAFFLRFYHYTALPRQGATFDEYAWTWLGINMVQSQTPISWSSQPQYEHRTHLIYQGAAFWIVRPYLEHPPLFGLIAGSSALLNGAHDMYSVTLGNMRRLSLVLGLFAVIMVYILSNALYGRNIALLSTIIYGTVPTMVIGSRIVQNENFLIPFWLLGLYLLHHYLKTGRKRFRNLAGILAGLLSLAKVPWLVVGLSFSMVLSYKGKWKDAIIMSIITGLFFLLFIIYGFVLDASLFAKLWTLQLARYDITFTGFFSIFIKPLLVDRYYLDGWILFGWFSVFFLAKEFKKHYLILIPFLAYLGMYIFAIPDEPGHGWYRYPFYPFLLIAAALVLKEEFRKYSLISVFFLLIVGLSLLGNVWQEVFGFSYFIYRIFIILTVLPTIYLLWKEKQGRLSTWFLGSWISIFILFNIFSVLVFVE
jgi:4-amino-4-deoxy-L-arabinose transferase-like glycosyltransferase